jgi:hypothetical protein
MKLPRWVMLSLLGSSLSLVIVSAGWWWVTWPSRTIREFTAALERGEYDDANQFLCSPCCWGTEESDSDSVLFMPGSRPARLLRYPSVVWRGWCTLENLQLEGRSHLDMIRGRQNFAYHRSFTTPFFIGGYAERGTIILRCENWAASPF